MKKIALVVALLLLGMGCIELNYTAEQTFNEDGSSTLKIDSFVGISPSYLSGDSSSLGSLVGKSGMVSMRLISDYLRSKYAAEDVCKNVEGALCKPLPNGHVEITKELKPGMFYAFEKETDWLNLEERYVYRIKKLPLLNYFTKGKQSREGLLKFFREHKEEYIPPEGLCFADGFCSVDDCDAVSGGFVLYPSINVEVEAYACLDELTPEAYGNISELPNAVKVGKVVEKDASYTVPCSTKYAVVSYKPLSAWGSEESCVYKRTSAEEAEKNLEEELSREQSPVKYNPTSGLYWDFTKGTFGGSTTTYESLVNMKSTMSAEIDVRYKATFPGKIEEVKIDGESIEAEGNTLSLSIDDLAGMPHGEIVVVVKKQMSPLGMYTWVVVALALAGVAWFLKKPAGGDKLSEEPRESL